MHWSRKRRLAWGIGGNNLKRKAPSSSWVESPPVMEAFAKKSEARSFLIAIITDLRP